MANINLNTGIIPNSQIPLDAKLYFNTFESLKDLGPSNYKAFMYYKGMHVYCVETKLHYVWEEVENTSLDIPSVLPAHFIYPPGSVVNGIDYSNKAYNFFEVATEVQDFNYNRIISGSVYWNPPGYSYSSTPIKYVFDGQVIIAPPTNVMLSPSSPNLDRIDVFVVDVEDGFKVIEGNPGESPLEPTIDFTRQLKVSAVFITRGTSEPVGATKLLIYDENEGTPSEWNASFFISGGGQGLVDMESTEDPYVNHVSILAENVLSNTRLIFQHPDKVNINDLTSLQFKCKSKSLRKFDLSVALYNNNLKIAQYLLRSGNFGFNPNINSQYSTVDIPISVFTRMNTTNPEINKIIITVSDGNSFTSELPISFYIDLIELLGSGTQPLPGTNSFLDLDEVLENSFAGLAGKVWAVDPTEKFLIPVDLPNFTLDNASNKIISGSVTKPDEDSVRVRIFEYFLNGSRVVTNFHEVLPIDPVEPGEYRLDYIVMDHSENLSIVQGVPGFYPVAPIVNLDDYIVVAPLLVRDLSGAGPPGKDGLTCREYLVTISSRATIRYSPCDGCDNQEVEEIFLKPSNCGSQVIFTSGSIGYPVVLPLNLGTKVGEILLQPNADNIPDRFMLYKDSTLLLDMGYLGGPTYEYGKTNRNKFTSALEGKLDPVTGMTYPMDTSLPGIEPDGYPEVSSPASQNFVFNKTSSEDVYELKVYAPIKGTGWRFEASCLDDDPGADVDSYRLFSSTPPEIIEGDGIIECVGIARGKSSYVVVPTKTSDLLNDGETSDSRYVEEKELADVAFSGEYSDLKNISNHIDWGETQW